MSEINNMVDGIGMNNSCGIYNGNEFQLNNGKVVSGMGVVNGFVVRIMIEN